MNPEVEKNLQTLKTLRDEIRVQAHLFNMEAKEMWQKLEPSIQKAEESAATALGTAVQALIEFRKALKA